MFKFLVLCCLLAVAHGGLIEPLVKIAPPPVAVKIAPLEIKSVPLITKTPLTKLTIAETPKAILWKGGWGGGWGGDSLGWDDGDLGLKLG